METNHQQNHFNNPVVIVLFLALIAVGGYFLFSKNSQNDKEQIQQQAEAQQKALESAQAKIEKLKQDSESAKTKQQQLEQTIKSAPKPATTNSLTSIIKGWRPRIAYVVCSWGSGSSEIEASGSGLLMKNWIATNDHVMRYGGRTPTACGISLPDKDTIYYADISSSNVYGGGVDMAGITIDNQDNYTDTLGSKPVNYCKRKAEIGESIVILGYPYTGSTNDITATEGIISGYDGYYYITSAKIEHGNSGGVAVLLKDNCYLGIPSNVSAGELESLGRILDARIMNDANYFENHPNGI